MLILALCKLWSDARLDAAGPGTGKPILQYSNYKVQNILGFAGASAGGITRLEAPKNDNTDAYRAVEAVVRGVLLGQFGVQQWLAVQKYVTKTQIKLILSFLALIGYLLSRAPQYKELDILREPLKLAQSLADDYGIFAAEPAWNFVHKCLVIAAARIQRRQEIESLPGYPSDKIQRITALFDAYEKDPNARNKWSEPFAKGMTFGEHASVFGVKLAVTGTNLETYQTHIFSADTTQNFFVEDAVRITMSLPGLFKPFVLKKAEDLKLVAPDLPELAGVYVDGGLLNNMPLHFFDNEPGANPKTLGLRLKIEERKAI
jgi:hypothetical protein